MLRWGLTAKGGMGYWVLLVDSDTNSYYLRFFLMLLFFFIVKVIFLSIIKGLIVEEFTFLREHKHHIEMNIKNKCFICDLDKSTLDTIRGGFS